MHCSWMKFLPTFLLVLLILLAGCSEEQPKAPPVEVVVADAQIQPYQPEAVYVGRLVATDDVEIQARVTGYLQGRYFEEGDFVEKKALLYEIDRSEYEADLAQAKAELARQRAAVQVARRNFERGQELVPQGYISESEFDELRATKLEATASLEQAQARVQSAEVALGYTRIFAPISGRIGRSAVSVGDLVGPNSGALTTLVSIDPIKASFQISEATLLTVVEQQADLAERIRVELELPNKTRYAHRGQLDFLANRVDPNTGTIAVRASVANPDALLRPGQYVRIHLLLPERDELMIPQAAVQSDQQGSFAMAVVDGQVVRHNVTLGERSGTDVIVEQGLEPGAQVIVRGLQKVQPGQSVQAVAADSGDRAAAPAGAVAEQPGEATRSGPDAGEPIREAAEETTTPAEAD